MTLRRFVIERDIPKVGSFEREQLRAAAAKSNEVLQQLGPDIQWVESYVADNKTFESCPAAWFRLHSRSEARRVARDQIVADSPAGTGGPYRRARGAASHRRERHHSSPSHLIFLCCELLSELNPIGPAELIAGNWSAVTVS